MRTKSYNNESTNYAVGTFTEITRGHELVISSKEGLENIQAYSQDG